MHFLGLSLSWPDVAGISIIFAVDIHISLIAHSYHHHHQVLKERNLGYDPCFIKWFGPKGGQLIIGGSNCKVGLYSKEGVFLHTIVERGSWVWSANKCPKTDALVGVTLHG